MEAQLKRHKGLECELMGTEQQVSPGLAASPTQARPASPLDFPHSLGTSGWAHCAPKGVAQGRVCVMSWPSASGRT